MAEYEYGHCGYCGKYRPLKWNGGYTETVPASSRYYRVIAQWDPRTYAVNYVLATDIKFNFGRANNQANPTTHTVGQSETLYNLKSPVGVS